MFGRSKSSSKKANTASSSNKDVDDLVKIFSKYKFDDINQAYLVVSSKQTPQKATTTSSKDQPTTTAPIVTSSSSEAKEEPKEDPLSGMGDDFKAKALRIFNNADKDKSGTIDEFELHDLLKEMLGPISLPESNLIYSEMDTNHSGTITFDEFLIGLWKNKWDTKSIEEKDPHFFEWEIPAKEVSLEKKLGEGIFGTVYRAKWRGASVAVKRLKNPDLTDELSDFKKEISILGKLRHPNIILFLGCLTNEKSNMCIITEFMDGGNLHDVIHEKKIRFDFKTTLGLMKQTAFGLNYLHLSNIVHRDLKLANMLVDKFYNVKLCDFGLSCAKPSNADITEAVGSPLWRAPEVLLKKPYNQSADIYSFVLCCWELMSLEQPYLDIEDFDQLVNDVAVQGKRPKVPNFAPSDLAQLFRLGWEGDPKKRPNCAQVIAVLERVSS